MCAYKCVLKRGGGGDGGKKERWRGRRGSERYACAKHEGLCVCDR